jgi:hypothetical protein
MIGAQLPIPAADRSAASLADCYDAATIGTIKGTNEASPARCSAGAMESGRYSYLYSKEHSVKQFLLGGLAVLDIVAPARRLTTYVNDFGRCARTDIVPDLVGLSTRRDVERGLR